MKYFQLTMLSTIVKQITISMNLWTLLVKSLNHGTFKKDCKGYGDSKQATTSSVSNSQIHQTQTMISYCFHM